MSIRRCTPKIAQDQERYYIDWDDDPRGEFVFYCDHISWADHTPEVEAMRAACIAAVEGAVYVPLSKSGLFLISRNTKLWDQRETWTRHGWLKYRDSAIAALREVQP